MVGSVGQILSRMVFGGKWSSGRYTFVNVNGHTFYTFVNVNGLTKLSRGSSHFSLNRNEKKSFKENNCVELFPLQRNF